MTLEKQIQRKAFPKRMLKNNIELYTKILFASDDEDEDFDGFNKEKILKELEIKRKVKAAEFVETMREVAKQDRCMTSGRRYKKISRLWEAHQFLKDPELRKAFFKHPQGIFAIADWLEIMPDNKLPHLAIRQVLLKILSESKEWHIENLYKSKIIKFLILLKEHHLEEKNHKKMILDILQHWMRLNPDLKMLKLIKEEIRPLCNETPKRISSRKRVAKMDPDFIFPKRFVPK